MKTLSKKKKLFLQVTLSLALILLAVVTSITVSLRSMFHAIDEIESTQQPFMQIENTNVTSNQFNIKKMMSFF